MYTSRQNNIHIKDVSRFIRWWAVETQSSEELDDQIREEAKNLLYMNESYQLDRIPHLILISQYTR